MEERLEKDEWGVRKQQHVYGKREMQQLWMTWFECVGSLFCCE